MPGRNKRRFPGTEYEANLRNAKGSVVSRDPRTARAVLMKPHRDTAMLQRPPGLDPIVAEFIAGRGRHAQATTQPRIARCRDPHLYRWTRHEAACRAKGPHELALPGQSHCSHQTRHGWRGP